MLRMESMNSWYGVDLKWFRNERNWFSEKIPAKSKVNGSDTFRFLLSHIELPQ